MRVQKLILHSPEVSLKQLVRIPHCMANKREAAFCSVVW
jgi:hypothetical protein